MDENSQWLARIAAWAKELGFSQIGVAGVDLSSSEPGLLRWLEQGFHGQMHYMAAHGLKRARPAELVPGTVSVITARMDYLPQDTPPGWQEREWQRLRHPQEAIISVYARGRDYHKVLRARPAELVPGTVSVITARMNYLPAGTTTRSTWRRSRRWPRRRRCASS